MILAVMYEKFPGIPEYTVYIIIIYFRWNPWKSKFFNSTPKYRPKYWYKYHGLLQNNFLFLLISRRLFKQHKDNNILWIIRTFSRPKTSISLLWLLSNISKLHNKQNYNTHRSLDLHMNRKLDYMNNFKSNNLLP